MKEELAELMGIHMGDGCLSKTKRYYMHYLGGDLKEEKEYHDAWVLPLMNICLPKSLFEKIKYKEYPSVGVYGAYTFNKELFDFFVENGATIGSKKEQKIPDWIKQDERLLKRFIRGIFDTDGNIYFDKNRNCKNPINNVPVIKLGSCSKGIIQELFDELKNLKFHPRLKKPYKGKKDKNPVHTILLYRREDVRRYISEIGFKNPKHSSKWELFLKQGSLLPKTTLKQRNKLLKRKN